MRLAGNVFQPGLYQWLDGHAARGPAAGAGARASRCRISNYVLIRREVRRMSTSRSSRRTCSALGGSRAAPRTSRCGRATPCTCFNLETGRQEVLDAAHRRARGASAAERAAADRARRRPSACAGRVSPRARHAHQRLAARRRRHERGCLRYRRGADALPGHRRRVSRDRARHGQSRRRCCAATRPRTSRWRRTTT